MLTILEIHDGTFAADAASGDQGTFGQNKDLKRMQNVHSLIDDINLWRLLLDSEGVELVDERYNLNLQHLKHIVRKEANSTRCCRQTPSVVRQIVCLQ